MHEFQQSSWCQYGYAEKGKDPAPPERNTGSDRMSALRNPKAHSNDEVLTAEEALRRLMFASMLMYKLDEAGL